MTLKEAKEKAIVVVMNRIPMCRSVATYPCSDDPSIIFVRVVCSYDTETERQAIKKTCWEIIDYMGEIEGGKYELIPSVLP